MTSGDVGNAKEVRDAPIGMVREIQDVPQQATAEESKHSSPVG